MSSNLTAPTIFFAKTLDIRDISEGLKLWHGVCFSAAMTTMARVNRSDLYHSIAEIRAINEARIARLDLWGSVIVIFLLVGGLNLMRVVLAN